MDTAAAWIGMMNALAVEVVEHGDWQRHAQYLRTLGGPGSDYHAAAEKLESIAAERTERLRQKVNQRREAAA